MKIKAFGMDIQVTEESVFVNGKEVYNKIDQAEQRMNVIGQNGNDGLHYQFWEQINTDLFNKDRLTDSNDPNDKTGIDY